MSESRRFAASDAKTIVSRGCVAPLGWRTNPAYRCGETIAGKYRLLELLGEGGMGVVWKAYFETLDVHVALKLLRPEPEDAESPIHGGRLLQEARAAARLGHPAIARVYDYGVCDQGNAFIVMELLEGEDLAHALARRGRLSPKKAVATLLPIVHALAAAHQKGIVHRDIKPDNIYLARCDDRRVQPKLVDFGIAKIERTRNTRLTQTGEVLGSPMYMSPEQARGDETDYLADVWAISVVLYEMIAGTTPFVSGTYTGLLYAIVSNEPIPCSDLGYGNRALWEIIQRGLEKDRNQRWASMRELGMELARWLADQGQREDITGASLDQWFHRIGSKADLLVSLIPPRYDVGKSAVDASALRTSASARITEIDVDVSLEAEPEESTFTGGVLSVPIRQARGRLVALAAASAALGGLIMASAFFIQRQTALPTLDPSQAAAQIILLPDSPPVGAQKSALASEASCPPPVERLGSGLLPEARESSPGAEAFAGVNEPRPKWRRRSTRRGTTEVRTGVSSDHRSLLKNPFQPRISPTAH